LHGDALRIVRRCAASASAEAAQLCVRRTLPTGMVLGDPERLRAVSERLLGEPARPSIPSPPEQAPAFDAGIDAGASAGRRPGAADVYQ
jgi:hypothetical protein